MSAYEQAVFISYAWGDEREEIVNKIDQALQKRGIKIVRDKRDLGYKGSIREFMERIGQGNSVIVIISDKYLRSPNCMFELVEIAENKQFHDRIFPVVLADAEIYKAVKQLQYIKHWENEIRELKEGIKEVDPTHLQGIYQKLDLYDRIRDNISNLIDILSDMNTLTPEMHQDSDFSTLYEAIARRMQNTPDQIKTSPANVTIDRESFEPETVFIPEGSFWMGSEPGEGIPTYETPRHEVFLPGYRIGKYSVTNEQFEKFILDTGRTVAPEMLWDGLRPASGTELCPVVAVSWYDAVAYCEWLSKITGRKYSLPNEAQWEKACRGSGQGSYPWGNEFQSARSNQGSDQIAAVNAFAAQNDYGCFDFVGNVRQWTSSLWGENPRFPDPRFAYPWKNDRRNDLAANSQVRRVVRGSSFRDDAKSLRCSLRSGQSPKGLVDVTRGFRVMLNT